MAAIVAGTLSATTTSFATTTSHAKAAAAAPGDGVITFRKVFKGSVPEFEEVKVSESGKCTFDIRQLAEDADVRAFEVGQVLRTKIFSLAEQLSYFKNADLDIHRKIANLGAKTFRWEKDGEWHETVFNYTLNPAGSQLVEIFEGLVRQQDHMLTLERRLRYDRLGVNEALLELKADYDNKLLPEPERLLPVLEQIANDARIVEIARQRARALTTKIRGAK